MSAFAIAAKPHWRETGMHRDTSVMSSANLDLVRSIYAAVSQVQHAGKE